jgi:hypothetical protein
MKVDLDFGRHFGQVVGVRVGKVTEPWYSLRETFKRPDSSWRRFSTDRGLACISMFISQLNIWGPVSHEELEE